MKKTTPAKPILKWAGGKQALAASLVEKFPANFEVFYEPFVGGASVLLMLQPANAVIGDSNKWLMDTYAAVRKNAEQVTLHLNVLRNTRTEYLRIRSVDPRQLDPYERAAHLIYLNKTCFRGLFRVNRDGQFNVPYGAYSRRYYDPENLRPFVKQLAKTEIRCGDFEACVQDASPRDFIYFDPPYFKLGGYSDFNRYTPGQFRADDHRRLAALCRTLDKKRVRWALTNSDTAFIRELFKDFHIQCVASRREINLNSRNRNISELLITNYQQFDRGSPSGRKNGHHTR